MQALLADCDPETRAKITEAFSHMIEELVDIYTAKFDYLFHAPYYAIGAYYCVQGGDGAHARGGALASTAARDVLRAQACPQDRLSVLGRGAGRRA